MYHICWGIASVTDENKEHTTVVMDQDNEVRFVAVIGKDRCSEHVPNMNMLKYHMHVHSTSTLMFSTIT